MTKIKICGLTRTEDIAYVNELLPDYIGFVFVSKSKRYVSPNRAATLKQTLDPHILATGVFVNESLETILFLANNHIIDVIQLHGNESDSYITELKCVCKLPVIKAFSIKNSQDLEQAKKSPADYILLDHEGGGTGKAFDWTLLKNIDRPYFLAGGLNPENVSAAISLYHPFAVDTSSGVETNSVKDYIKIKKFITTVNNLNG